MAARTPATAMALILLLFTTLAQADKLIMKDGQVLEGTIVGRSQGMVHFEIAGQELRIPEASIESAQMSLGDGSAPEAEEMPEVAEKPAAKPAAPPPPPPPPTLASGTRMVLRMSETIDSRKHQAGHRFVARLESDLATGGTVVARRGTTAYGQLMSASQSGRVFGTSEMTLVITDLLINDHMYPVSTQPLSAKTENTAKQSTRRVARGAILGGLIDGSDGAKTGAAVGAGVAILTSGNSINIPSGTIVETQLRAPFTLQ